MVRGLDLWREHCADFADAYVLIGGVACQLAMERLGGTFRATQDLDIVLCLEHLDPAFIRALWGFIRAGGYQTHARDDGHRRVYRFHKPADDRYPTMLELFSRHPDGLDINGESLLTPLPMSDDLSSLSAILLDDDYYALIQAGRRVDDHISYLAPEYLIPLKARAWLDLSARRDAGERVDSSAIKKHRNDCVRLAAIIPGNTRIPLTEPIRADIGRLIEGLSEHPVQPHALGLIDIALADILALLHSVYM